MSVARLVAARVRGRHRTVLLCTVASLAAATLAACGGGSRTTEPPTLTWYVNTDAGNPGATKGGQTAIAQECSGDAGDAYQIVPHLLPTAAAQQRDQLVRRLAAHDSSIDLMSLDPAFTAEFAAAEFLAPIPSDQAAAFTDGVLDGAVKAATYDGKLVAVPFWSDTQVLWYRKSVAVRAGLDMSKPVTWDQIIEAAEQTHTTVQVQTKTYEGYAVWINALISSAGGAVVSDVGAGKEATIGVDTEPGRKAATVIEHLVDTGVASPAVSTAGGDESVAGFVADDGGFMVNWEYVYADPAVAPIAGDLGWAPYPRVDAEMPSRAPLSGVDIGVSNYSDHAELAYQAAACITSVAHQKSYALSTGHQASRENLYDDPDIVEAYPMAPLWKESITGAAPVPATPYWSEISAALFSSWHPPASVDPDTTPKTSQSYISDVLTGKALL